MKKNISVIIAAAGESSRLNKGISKQFVLLNGKPLLFYSLSKFVKLENLIEIVVVTSDIDKTKEYVDGLNFLKGVSVKIIPGGKLRQDSVYNGFSNLSSCAELVLIHDVARPLFDLNDVKKCIEEAKVSGACILAIKVIDTIKSATSHNDRLIVNKTIDRSNLYLVQTPQVFSYDLLNEAYKQKTKDVFTDESQLVEKLGKEITIQLGSKSNIKITYSEDLEIASKMLEEDLQYARSN